ncbi:hypothetical protein BGX26_009713 [Mortierella sp. AD094]|nr:hypothetical protein BGX26_009713 [Mortierella sp. AD094]
MSALVLLFRDMLVHATRGNVLKLFLAFAVFYIYRYRSHAIGTHRRRDLKQPKGAYPILGHMPLLASVPETELYQFFEKMYNELGPVWSISLPGFGRMIQIDTPENIEHALKTNFWSYEKGPILKGIFGELMGNGIFLADGANWKLQRQLSSHIFDIKAFRDYTSDVFVIEGKKVIAYLGKAADEGIVVDFQALMLHFTLDSIGAISFGKSFGCLDNVEVEVPFAVSLDDMLENCTRRLVDPMWKIRERLTGAVKRNDHDRRLIRNYALEIIKTRRCDGNQGNRKDFLQLFMEGKDSEGQHLSDDFLVDIIINFMGAARDTTSHALTWMLYMIYRDGADENIAKTLIQEVDNILGESDPTYDTYKKQKYTEACFNEALRIFPPLPRNLRYCVKDDILPDGTKINAGEWVGWSSYVMGRSESLWGPDAKEFKPSRWINSEKPSRGKFSSFHLGPRTCLGQQYATIQALTIISMILQSFDIRLDEPSKAATYGTSLAFPMVGGLKIRVSRRSETKA